MLGGKISELLQEKQLNTTVILIKETLFHTAQNL